MVCATDFQLIVGQLYKLGPDEILRRYVLEHERSMILREAHEGVVGGHYARSATAKKVLQVGLWWPALHKEAKEYSWACDIFQRLGKLNRIDAMPLVPQITLRAFDKWAINFVGHINPPGRRTSAWYIINVNEYLIRWANASPVQDCMAVTAAKFLFENVVMRFGCP